MDGRRRGVSGFLPWTAPCGVGSGCFHRHRTTSAYRREKSRLMASGYSFLTDTSAPGRKDWPTAPRLTMANPCTDPHLRRFAL